MSKTRTAVRRRTASIIGITRLTRRWWPQRTVACLTGSPTRPVVQRIKTLTSFSSICPSHWHASAKFCATPLAVWWPATRPIRDAQERRPSTETPDHLNVVERTSVYVQVDYDEH